MKKMDLRPLPERILITLYGCRGGDKSNEGWFFLNPNEWEKFKVQLACSTESIPVGTSTDMARHRGLLAG